MKYENGQHWREVRCSGVNKNGECCRALLCLEYVFAGRLAIKCSKCNHITEIKFRTPNKIIDKLIDNDNRSYK